jgi:hypothetical protein
LAMGRGTQARGTRFRIREWGKDERPQNQEREALAENTWNREARAPTAVGPRPVDTSS